VPLNDRKIISIILDERARVEERFPGYRDELINTISDIIEYERQHKVQGTTIQKKINDKCNAMARLLAQHRGHDVGAEE